MMRLIVTITAVCVLLAGGCSSPQAKQDASVEKIESQVLGAAFADIFAESLVQMKQEDGQLPPEAKEPDFIIRYLEMIKGRFPSIFLVSAKQEADFKAGRFQDDTNMKSMEHSIQELSDYGVELPGVSVLLVNKLKDGKLEGAQLEFAARLLAAQLAEIRALAGDHEPEN